MNLPTEDIQKRIKQAFRSIEGVGFSIWDANDAVESMEVRLDMHIKAPRDQRRVVFQWSESGPISVSLIERFDEGIEFFESLEEAIDWVAKGFEVDPAPPKMRRKKA